MFQRFFLMLWLFCGVLVCVAIIMEQGMGVVLFSGWTYDAIKELTDSMDFSGMATPDPIFIFGNMYKALAGIVTLTWQTATGGLVTDTLCQIPIVGNMYIMMLIRFLYGFSTALFAVQMITGRMV